MRNGKKSDGGKRSEKGRQTELSALNENHRQINALSGKKKNSVQRMNLGCWISREHERMCVGLNFRLLLRTSWCVCPVAGWETV